MNNGLRIYSQPVITQIFGIYEKNVTDALLKVCIDPQKILVAGLHNGYTAIKLAKLYNVPVVGIEANPTLCDDAIKTIDINKLKDITVVRNSIGYENSKFGISGDENGMIYSSSEASPDTIFSLNPIVPFSDIVNRYGFQHTAGNLLIMDIEGFEESVLDYEGVTVFNCFDHIMLEWHSLAIKKKFIDAFSACGGDAGSWKIVEIPNMRSRNDFHNGHILFIRINQ